MPCKPKNEGKPVPGGTFVTKKEVLELVKKRNHGILEAGHVLSVRPGVLIQKVRSGATYRYQLREEGK